MSWPHPPWTRALLGLASIVACAWLTAPALWLLLTSVMTEAESMATPPHWIPREPTLDNYRALLAPDGVYERPANVFVATFVGSPAMNLMRGRLVAEDGANCFDGPSGRLPLAGVSPSSDRAVVLGVRPEDLQIGNEGAGGAWSGRVHIREPNGADVFLTVRVGGHDLVARTDRSASAAPGSCVSLMVHPDRFHLFDADTGDRIDAGGPERP